MVSILEGCSEGCGWTAAVIAVLSWGTFGVPIKVTTTVEVNFFVMQSYKTIVCFLTCWLVILLGEPVRFTPWGIVSGIFWVPGASCGIYAIRNAGVAIAFGTWSAIQVCTSFFFGIIIFQEHVKDMKQTIVAFVILMTGLVGMSIFSEAPMNQSASGGEYEAVPATDTMVVTSKSLLSVSSSTRAHPTLQRKNGKRESRLSESHQGSFLATSTTPDGLGGNSPSNVETNKMIPLQIDESMVDLFPAPEADEKSWHKDRIELFGGRIALSRRQMGILGAVVNGAWGGLNLIPLHYARRDEGLSGAGYLISYASGSMLVCIAIWVGIFLYHLVRREYNVHEALNQLPAWHVRELGIPGFLAGILYSIGNFCSILAVTYLGQGVGFSFCQGQLLISGLWGVFFFGEIQGRETIAKWFASAGVTIVGIIWLSYQHESTPVHRSLSFFDQVWDLELLGSP